MVKESTFDAGGLTLPWIISPLMFIYQPISYFNGVIVIC